MNVTAPGTVAPHRRPLWLGVVFAPWVAPFALALIAYVGDRAGGGRHSGTGAIEVLAFALVLGVPMAYCGVLGLGLPLVLALRARNRLSAARVLVCAMLAGALTWVLAFWWLDFKLALSAQLGIGAAMGLAVVLAFCLLCGIPWYLPRGPRA
jgi:hypothetical protein